MSPTAHLSERLRGLCRESLTRSDVHAFLAEARIAAQSEGGLPKPERALQEILLAAVSCAEPGPELGSALCFCAHPEVQAAIHESACGQKFDSGDLLLRPQLQYMARALAAPISRKLGELSPESFEASLHAATEDLLSHPQQFRRAAHAVLMAQFFYAGESPKRLFLLHQARNGFPIASCMGKFRLLQQVYLDAALCPEIPEAIRLEAKELWMRQPGGFYPAFCILGSDISPSGLFLRQQSIFSEAASRPNPSHEELLYLHKAARELADCAMKAQSADEVAKLLPMLSRLPQAHIAAAFTMNGEEKLFDLAGNFLSIFDRRAKGNPTACPTIEFALLDFFERLAPETFANDYLYFIRTLAEADAAGDCPVDNDGKPGYAFAHAALQKGLEFNSLEAILDINTERLGPDAVRAAVVRRIRRANAFAPALQSAYDKLALLSACPDSRAARLAHKSV